MHGLDNGVCLTGFARVVKLSVICKGLVRDRVRLQEGRERLRVQNEEDRPENRTLRDPERQGRLR